jgi:hypothetical protein
MQRKVSPKKSVNLNREARTMKLYSLFSALSLSAFLLCVNHAAFAQDKQGRPNGERRIEQSNARPKENKSAGAVQNRSSQADAIRQATRQRTEQLRNERSRQEQAKAAAARASQSRQARAPASSKSANVVQRTSNRAANAIKKR